jgi:hypothetical protein
METGATTMGTPRTYAIDGSDSDRIVISSQQHAFRWSAGDIALANSISPVLVSHIYVAW